MKLIGITGRAGSGKDTVANHLVSQYRFERYGFADPIKKGLEAMGICTMDHMLNRSLKESELHWLGKSPRQLQQTLGTEWGRNLVHQDLWLLLAQRRWESMLAALDVTFDNPGGLVISDVRFDNEADWVRKAGGTIWHLLRKDAGEVSHHVSEKGVTVWPPDVVIQNNFSISELLKQAEMHFSFPPR